MSTILATVFTVSMLTWGVPLAVFGATLVYVLWTMIGRPGRTK